VLGVSLSQLEVPGPVQGVFALDEAGSSDHARVERRARGRARGRRVRDRFGSLAVGPASLSTQIGGLVIKIGLVGCGHIGTVHAYVIQQLADAQVIDACLSATFDADPKRAERVAAITAASRRHRSPSSLPRSMSCGSARGRRRTSKPSLPPPMPADRCFCEKPLGPDLATSELVAAALVSALPHQVGLVLRFSPVYENAAQIISSGEYGRPLAAVLRDDQYFPSRVFYGSTWRKDVAHAGGAR
jgi:hypothetical protein